jgi:hypothetical protein
MCGSLQGPTDTKDVTVVRTFDFTPLTAPNDRVAVDRLRRESNAAKIVPTEFSDVFILWMCVVGSIVGGGLLAVGDLGLPSSAIVIKILYSLTVGPCMLMMVLGVFYSIYRLQVRWGQYYRVLRFAEVNAMTYSVTEAKPTWDGFIFKGDAEEARAASVFTATGVPVFEVGNYHYSHRKPDGKLSDATAWGYIVVELGSEVPPMMLRSRSRLSTKRWALGAYARNPVLSLGPDADRHYVLYCPAGQEDIARRLFTPELISAFSALGRSVDVEVSGSHLFVYSCKPFRFPRPRAVRAAFAIISLASLNLRFA